MFLICSFSILITLNLNLTFAVNVTTCILSGFKNICHNSSIPTEIPFKHLLLMYMFFKDIIHCKIKKTTFQWCYWRCISIMVIAQMKRRMIKIKINSWICSCYWIPGNKINLYFLLMKSKKYNIQPEWVTWDWKPTRQLQKAPWPNG